MSSHKRNWPVIDLGGGIGIKIESINLVKSPRTQEDNYFGDGIDHLCTECSEKYLNRGSETDGWWNRIVGLAKKKYFSLPPGEDDIVSSVSYWGMSEEEFKEWREKRKEQIK